MTQIHITHNTSNASQSLISPEILSNPLLLRHFELVMQAVEKGETERLNDHLRLSNAAIEKGLGLTAAPAARPNPFNKPFKPFRNAFIRAVEREVEGAHLHHTSSRARFANMMDLIRRLLERGVRENGREFITLSHKNLAKLLGISIRQAQRHIALAKETSILDVRTVRNRKQGRRMVVKKGIHFAALEPYKRQRSQGLEDCSTLVEQTANFSKVNRQLSSRVYKSTHVRVFLNPLANMSTSLPSSRARRRNEKSPEKEKNAVFLSQPMISKTESASKVISSPPPRPSPPPSPPGSDVRVNQKDQISSSTSPKPKGKASPVASQGAPNNLAYPLPAAETENFAEQAYALFQRVVLANLSYPVKIHPKTFSALINRLRNSHFPTLEAVKAYLGKVAVNPFLMGLKPNKDGKFWRIDPHHLFSGRIIEDSWAGARFFNVYEPRVSAEEEDAMGHRKEPVKLEDLSLDEVVATAKTSIDLNVKMALFQKLGSDTYKSWFHDNGFVFGGQDGTGLQFVVDGIYARKVILERYGNMIQETLSKLDVTMEKFENGVFFRS
jgi:hypothetical protein